MTKKTSNIEIYNEGEMTAENNLETDDVHVSIEQACREKYDRGREHFGREWVGQRGAVEAYDELIDAMVYIGLEKNALLIDFDPATDEMTGPMLTQLEILDKLLDDIRGALIGLSMFINITDDDNNWGRMFP